MIIIPAIDLKDGQVVRLRQGRLADVTVFSSDPVEMAAHWIGQGARRLHLVDLNGAFSGRTIHHDVIKQIVQAHPDIEIEVGGGIRSLDSIQAYLDLGVSFCILGSMAVQDPELFARAVESFPGQIILGLDAKGVRVATEGWDRAGQKEVWELLQEDAVKKVAQIIYTDIQQDGMMQGVNLQATEVVARKAPVPIIASGGLSSLNDISGLMRIKNCMGVIAGRALYDGRLQLSEAIKLAEGQPC